MAEKILKASSEFMSINLCEHLSCKRPADKPPYCKVHAKKWRDIRLEFAQKSKEAPQGIADLECIYVIGSDEFEPVKIGRARNPLSRVMELQIGNPFRLKLLSAFFMPRHACVFIEWRCHHELKKMGFSVSGEWFDLCHSEADAVIHKCAKNEGVIARTPHEVLVANWDYEHPHDYHDTKMPAFLDHVVKVKRAIQGYA